jgi:alpha-tubulin suppressor-like RCC1 family protein
MSQGARLFPLLCALVAQAIVCEAQDVVKIASGGSYSLFLKSDSTLLLVGYNGVWSVSDNGVNEGLNKPPRPPQLVASNVITMAASEGHFSFVKSDGSLWGVGDSEKPGYGSNNVCTNFPAIKWGAEGTSNECSSYPEMIAGSNVTAVSEGNVAIFFLKRDGSLWGMGGNWYGALGIGTPGFFTSQPEMIVGSNVNAVAAGGVHTLFLKNDGSLWAMGYNLNGQLGDGTYGEYSKPGAERPEMIVASNVTAIAAGNMNNLFIKRDGSLWGMGSDTFGQLGDGLHHRSPNRPEMIVPGAVTAVSEGGENTLFLKSDGSLWGMGSDQLGQLGDGLSGLNYVMPRPEVIVKNGVKAVAAGINYSLFLKDDGSLWAMGDNGCDEFGDGTNEGTNRPECVLTAPRLNKFWRPGGQGRVEGLKR